MIYTPTNEKCYTWFYKPKITHSKSHRLYANSSRQDDWLSVELISKNVYNYIVNLSNLMNSSSIPFLENSN